MEMPVTMRRPHTSHVWTCWAFAMMRRSGWLLGHRARRFGDAEGADFGRFPPWQLLRPRRDATKSEGLRQARDPPSKNRVTPRPDRGCRATFGATAADRARGGVRSERSERFGGRIRGRTVCPASSEALCRWSGAWSATRSACTARTGPSSPPSPPPLSQRRTTSGLSAAWGSTAPAPRHSTSVQRRRRRCSPCERQPAAAPWSPAACSSGMWPGEDTERWSGNASSSSSSRRFRQAGT